MIDYKNDAQGIVDGGGHIVVGVDKQMGEWGVAAGVIPDGGRSYAAYVVEAGEDEGQLLDVVEGRGDLCYVRAVSASRLREIGSAPGNHVSVYRFHGGFFQ